MTKCLFKIKLLGDSLCKIIHPPFLKTLFLLNFLVTLIFKDLKDGRDVKYLFNNKMMSIFMVWLKKGLFVVVFTCPTVCYKIKKSHFVSL